MQNTFRCSSRKVSESCSLNLRQLFSRHRNLILHFSLIKIQLRRLTGGFYSDLIRCLQSSICADNTPTIGPYKVNTALVSCDLACFWTACVCAMIQTVSEIQKRYGTIAASTVPWVDQCEEILDSTLPVHLRNFNSSVLHLLSVCSWSHPPHKAAHNFTVTQPFTTLLAGNHGELTSRPRNCPMAVSCPIQLFVFIHPLEWRNTHAHPQQTV